MNFRKRLLAAISISALATCAPAADYRVETWAEGLDLPWSIAFLTDGSVLVTELGGRLRPVSAGGRVGEPVANVPAVYFAGQGGLFDVVLHPDFEDTRLVPFLRGGKPAGQRQRDRAGPAYQEHDHWCGADGRRDWW